MDSNRFTFDKGDHPLDWTLRILPVVVMFFGIVWCMWFVRRANNTEEAQTPQTTTTEDPVDLKKKRAFIETKLVTRTVLTLSPEGNITYSDPIEATTCSSEAVKNIVEPIKNVEENETTHDTANETAPQEVDEEQPLPSKDCCCDEESIGGGSCNLFSSSSSVDAETSPPAAMDTASVRQSSRRPGLIRMLSSALYKEEDTHGCDICLTDYEVGDQVCFSPNDDCIHAFHKDCILDWTMRNPNCPVCRRNYIGEEAV